MDKHGKRTVSSRNQKFVERTATKIWYEQPSDDNPYIAQAALCYGYDLYQLMEKRSFVDVFYLIFRGQLPNPKESKLLQTLMIALISPGSRHPATRAAMNVGIGKTNPLHILPIASTVLGGEYMGGGEIDEAMRFFRNQQSASAETFFQHLMEGYEQHKETKSLSAPGFGTRNGGKEIMAIEIANRLAKLEGAGKALQWGCEFNSLLAPHGLGWLMTGVAAAVFADLGFHPRAGGCLFQLLGAPGLVAHGLELAHKPLTDMPFISDENYVIKR